MIHLTLILERRPADPHVVEQDVEEHLLLSTLRDVGLAYLRERAEQITREAK